jgi:tRNA threonylcarbamoyl adenosine modification protein (Sua5/YciO/YrdC/YwlC family)
VETQVLSADFPAFAYQAVGVLQHSGLVAFPTDTVYGVGCLAFDAAGIERLFAAKLRHLNRAIPILVGDPADLELVTLEMSAAARRLAEAFWPGPLTIVVPRHPALPANLGPEPTVGVRMPGHPAVLALLRLAGPMAVTSANLSGQPAATTAAEALAQLAGRIELLIDGGTAPGGLASTVVDCAGATPAILRPGPVSLAQLQAVLAGGSPEER